MKVRGEEGGMGRGGRCNSGGVSMMYRKASA